MRRITFAVCRVYRQYGGAEEGGWDYKSGVVKAVFSLVTDITPGTTRESFSEDDYTLFYNAKGKARHIAEQLGYDTSIPVKHDWKVQSPPEYDVIHLPEEWEINHDEIGENWYHSPERVQIGSHIPIECPYYC